MNPPTAAFLEELRERARRHGWRHDYIEVESFVRAVYGEAGIATADVPDLTPYEICETCDRITPDCTCPRP